MDPRHAYPSEAALKLLNTRFSGRCMLPKLRDIGWIGASPEQLELALQLIVSPILTDFRLGVSPRGPLNASQAIPALKALAPAYNSLVGIHICNSTIHDPHIIDAASTVLLKCNPEKLRYFHVDSALSVEAFTYATQLPNLESFFIRTEPTEFDVPPLPTSPVFPSLGSLEINANDTRSPFLQTIANLGLEFPAATLRTFLPTTITALRPRGLHQTLTRLSITPEGDFDLDMAALRPLLFLNQLTYLEITFLCSQDRCPHNLSDKNLEELVKAMPKLELLSLGPIPCAQPANSTLKSLVSIAKHCKHMQTLIIHTNVEAIVHEMLHHGEGGEGPPLEDPLSPFPACPLSSINFGPCFIPNDEQGATIFALTLLRLFPLLNSVTVFPPLRERCPLWELVGGAITTHRGIHVNIADAGRFTRLLSHTKFAHTPQSLIRRSIRPLPASFFLLRLLVSRIPSGLYSLSIAKNFVRTCLYQNSIATARIMRRIAVDYCIITI